MPIYSQRKPFNSTSVSEIVGFCLLNPHYPNHSKRTLNRFLVALSSSDSLVFDFYCHGERALVAVLVDNIQNPSNSANLEVIGFKAGMPYVELVESLLQEAKTVLPGARSGIEFGVNKSSKLTDSVLRLHGFAPHYETFDMTKSPLNKSEFQMPTTEYQWQTLSNERFEEYYEILTAAFSKNLETSIPPLIEMKAGFQSSKFPASLLCKRGQVIGFASISVDDIDDTKGEVHMIGLHPSQRQKGLGSILLSKALLELASHGVTTAKLTVAAANEDALHLYKKFGFSVVNSDTCYRFPVIR